MITAIKQEPKEFLKSIQALFNEIEPWAIAKNLLIKHNYVTLNEEKYGIYEAETIQVFTITNEKIAELLPVGASIIGAKGRVDLVGCQWPTELSHYWPLILSHFPREKSLIQF
jgi:hypothetical protein